MAPKQTGKRAKTSIKQVHLADRHQRWSGASAFKLPVTTAS